MLNKEEPSWSLHLFVTMDVQKYLIANGIHANVKFHIVSNLSRESYNGLLTSSVFYSRLEACGCETALIFQSDVLALLPGSVWKTFVQYDYVGAPWVF